MATLECTGPAAGDDLSCSHSKTFAMRVLGDSMHPRFRAGELAIVDPSIEPQDGDDVVVVCTNGRKLLSQLNWRRDGEMQLLPVNADFPPLTLRLADVGTVQFVCGNAGRL